MNRIELLLSYLKDSPADPFLHFALAQEYAALNQLEDALEKYDYLMEMHPNYVGTYYHAGQTYERVQNLEKAMTCYQKGIEIAKEANDKHSASELEGVKILLEDRL